MATEQSIPQVLHVPSGEFVIEESWPFLGDQRVVAVLGVGVLELSNDTGGSCERHTQWGNGQGVRNNSPIWVSLERPKMLAGHQEPGGDAVPQTPLLPV